IQLRAVLAQLAELARLVQLVDEYVRLPVEDLVTALHGELRDGLRAMALAGAGLTDQKRSLTGIDKLQRGELEDVALGHLGVVSPVEAVQVLALRETGGAIAPIEEARAPSIELVLHEPGEGLEEVRLVAGNLHGARLEGGDHPREAQRAQCAV